MIHNLSEIITNFLASKKVINENESDIYIYGYETFFSGVIDLIITLILGILFRRLITAIVFFVMFVSVRMYTGGYHADSYLKCKMIFIGIIISVLGVTYIKFPLYIVFLIIALFLITVYRLCPIENPNKPLSKQQKRKYRKISLLFSIIWSIAAIITYFNTTHISMTIVSSEFIISLLMFVGIVRKEGKGNEKECDS